MNVRLQVLSAAEARVSGLEVAGIKSRKLPFTKAEMLDEKNRLMPVCG